MKTIKNMKHILFAGIAALSLAMASCDLDETPTSFVDPDDYYKTQAQCVTGLNSCYIPLKTIYSYTYLIVTEGVTDLLFIQSGTTDAQLRMSPANPLYGQTMWTQGYKGVVYSNAAIEGIRRSPLDEEVKKPLLAEGIVMRAYYYWFLTSTFGDVPFYTDDVANAEVMHKVAVLGRMPADETREHCINELREYVPYLPQVRSSDVADNRCGAAMGWMLMAKMAQWNKDWDTALEALGHLEKIYGSLDQYSLEDVLFRRKNTPESIFEIQHTYTEGGLNYTSTAAAICMPVKSGNYYDGLLIPELGTRATTWTALRPNQYYYTSLQTRKGTDKRTAYNLAWEYDGKEFNNPKSTGRPWLGPKFWCPDMVNTSDHNNYKVFRYADAILMIAECHMELQNADEAIRYLNMVKERAGITPYTFRNWDHLREEIYKERGRELLGEFQRKYDLVRWGIWYRMTYDYTDYGTVKTNILPCHEYYPIPDAEVIYSEYTLDNKAYAEYGM